MPGARFFDADAVRAVFCLPNLAALVIAVVATSWTAGSRPRRLSGVALVLTALLPCWLVPAGHPLIQALSGLFAFTWVMRVSDLHRGEWPVLERFRHAFSVVDTRRLVASTTRFRLQPWMAAFAWAIPAFLAYLLLSSNPPQGAVAYWVARWGCAIVIIYAGVSAGYSLARGLYALLGFETGQMHAAPMLSRSVQEFWGERWARPINTWLRDTFFRPLARRGHLLGGALLAFAVSAAFHAYVVWVALGLVTGLAMTGCMLAYFLLQTGVVALERLLGVRRWAPWRGHAWTVLWMLATAPLFLEPAVQVLGIPAR